MEREARIKAKLTFGILTAKLSVLKREIQTNPEKCRFCCKFESACILHNTVTCKEGLTQSTVAQVHGDDG
jgi:hypothetical protein